MKHQRVTLSDIAREAAVSVRTVSRILNGSGQLHHADTVRRVTTAALRLGYVPNATARAVRTGRFGAVALLLSTDAGRSYLPPNLFEGIHTELAAGDLHLVVAAMADDQLVQNRLLPKILRQRMIDGLLVNYTHQVPPALTRLIARLAIPAVWINNKRPTDAAFFDDEGAARQMTRYLIALGHRRILYLDLHSSGPEASLHYSSTDRRRGYESAMIEAGLMPWSVREERPLSDAERIELAAALLAGPDRPTAVVTYSPGCSFMPVYLAAVGRHRWGIPKDLSIATFSPSPHETPGIEATQMVLPEHKLGCEAVRLLRRQMENPTKEYPSVCLTASLLPGASAGPPPADAR